MYEYSRGDLRCNVIKAACVRRIYSKFSNLFAYVNIFVDNEERKSSEVRCDYKGENNDVHLDNWL